MTPFRPGSVDPLARLPRLRAGLLLRPRLLQRLDAGLQAALTLVSAPAGSGKTTLLVQWLRARQSALRGTGAPGSPAPPVGAWLAVSPDGWDAAALVREIVLALQPLLPQVAPGVLQVLAAPQPPARSVLAGLISELASLPVAPEPPLPPFVLVLDDAQLLHDAEAWNLLGLLVEQLPAVLHLLIATREDPPLPLARWRVRGLLHELRAADLRFGLEEASSFLNRSMNLQLSAEQIAVLAEHTEGWITGLQLAALLLQHHGEHQRVLSRFSGGNRLVADYLAEEVLQRLPAATQRFLLCSSLLDQMCAGVCACLLQADPALLLSNAEVQQAQAMLEYLERANLFVVALDDQRQWYRYQQLFAEMLRTRLLAEQGSEAITQLHRRAGGWFAAQGLAPEAIRHLLAAGDLKAAAGLIEAIAPGALAHGQFHQRMAVWLRALPEPLLRARPRLAIQSAWLALDRHDFGQAHGWLESAQQASAGSADTSLRRELSALQALLSAATGSDALAGIAAAREALALLPAEQAATRALIALAMGLILFGEPELAKAEAAVREGVGIAAAAGYAFLELGSVAMLVAIQRVRGALYAADEYARSVLARSSPRNGLFSYGMLLLAQADLLREWLELEQAQRLLVQGLPLSEDSGDLDVTLLGRVTEARLRWAQGDLVAAEAAFRRMLALSNEHGALWGIAVAHAALGQLALQRADLAAATALLRVSQTVGGDPLGRLVPTIVVFVAEHVLPAPLQLLLAQAYAGESGAQQAFPAELQRLQAVASQAGLHWLQTKCLVLAAQFHFLHNRLAAALHALEEAIQLAAPAGYLYLFVEQGATLRRCLFELSPQLETALPQFLPYLRRLRAAFPAGAPQSDAESGSFDEPLTPRELQVLQLLAQGLSNNEIAARLLVGSGTIKTHLKNLYAKLGARNRVEAVAAARRLRLLE